MTQVNNAIAESRKVSALERIANELEQIRKVLEHIRDGARVPK